MRIFVTGGTGLVGSNVIHVAREKYGWDVVASRHTRTTDALDVDFLPMDITDGAAVLETIRRVRPDVVIHCAATVDTDRLERDHALGWRLMVTATESLVAACRAVEAKLVFVSTDWVFDGETPPFTERSVPAPVCYYGFLKVVGETTVRSSGINAAIARISAVYGVNRAYPQWEPTEKVTGFGTLPNWMLRTLRRGDQIVEWTDHVNVAANPTLASDCADAMLTIAGADLAGTFHCSGRTCVDRVQLGRLVAREFGLDETLVRAATPEEMHPRAETLPPRTCLDVTASETATARRNLPVEEGLRVWHRELDSIGDAPSSSL